jgi:hypothetical protein
VIGSTPRHQIGTEGGVVVFLEIGPIERDDDLGPHAEHEAHPRVEQVPRSDGAIVEQTVGLFGSMLGLAADQLGVGPADRVHRERGRVQNAGGAGGQGEYAFGVQILAEGSIDEGANVLEKKASGRACGHGRARSAFATRDLRQAEHSSSVICSEKNEGTTQRGYPKALRVRVVAYAERAVAAGRPRATSPDGLGVAPVTLTRWERPVRVAAPGLLPRRRPRASARGSGRRRRCRAAGGVRIEGQHEQADELAGDLCAARRAVV